MDKDIKKYYKNIDNQTMDKLMKNKRLKNILK